MRPRPADYLQPEERVLLQQRRHPLSVLDEVLGIAVFWLIVGGAILWSLLWAPFLLTPEMQVLAWSGFALVSLLSLWFLAYRLFRMLTSLYTVTDERVYEAHGRLWFHLLQTTYDRVTDLQLRQSPFGRMFGFGTVTLQTAGTGLPLRGIRDPLSVKQSVEEARARFLAGLSGPPTSRKTAKTAPPPVPEPLRPDVTVWEGRPAPASLVAGLLGPLPILAVGTIYIVVTPSEAGWGWLPGAAMVVFAVMAMLRNAIQYATTRFEIRSSGLVVTSGWLGRRRVEATYEKVTDLATQQTVLGRIFGFGTIRVSTAGSTGAAVVFGSVSDPDRVKATIAQARAERIGSRL